MKVIPFRGARWGGGGEGMETMNPFEIRLTLSIRRVGNHYKGLLQNVLLKLVLDHYPILLYRGRIGRDKTPSNSKTCG